MLGGQGHRQPSVKPTFSPGVHGHGCLPGAWDTRSQVHSSSPLSQHRAENLESVSQLLYCQSESHGQAQGRWGREG